MSDFVFLGPSLPSSVAAQIHPDAVLLDPVAMGDVFLLARGRAARGDRIAIIDGLFEQQPAVWHKEILFALEQGIEVHGASSMGALRAAELDHFGMIGHGRIYQAFRSGQIEDDDEVAVAHATAEQGYRSLSDAMAAIRLGLQDMHGEGLLAANQHASLLEHAKSTPYGRRSWAELVRYAKDRHWNEEQVLALRAAARERDIKGQDARELLRFMAATPAGTAQADPVRLQRTSFWESLVAQSLERAETSGNDGDTGLAQLASQVVAADAERDHVLLLAKALLRSAEGQHADLASWELLDASLALAREHAISCREQMENWRACQGLQDDAQWQAFLGRYALARRPLAAGAAERNRAIADALRITGRWQQAEQRRLDIESRYSANYYKSLALGDVGLAPDSAEHWYRKRLGPMLPNPETHAERLGFATLRDLLANLAAVAGVEAAREPPG